VVCVFDSLNENVRLGSLVEEFYSAREPFKSSGKAAESGADKSKNAHSFIVKGR
jgi:hypothetical protein